MAYVGKHNLHMIHKLTKPVFSIVSSATFKSSGLLRFALLWLIFFIICFSPNRSAFFQFMHIGQFFKFSFNEETLLSPTIYYQRLSSVQRLCYQESKRVFVSSANGDIWIFFDFDIFYQHAKRCRFADFTLNPKNFPEIATTLQCSRMGQCRCVLKQIMNDTLK